MLRTAAVIEAHPRCALCESPVDPDSSLVWVRDGYPILRCRTCGLLFRRDPPEPESLTGLYDDGYFRARELHNEGGEGYPDYVGEEDLHRRNARRRLELLERFVDPGRLLDVGCAAGFFVDEARKRGWDAVGIELAPSMARFAREELNLEVIEASFTDADPPGPAFDAVTMWDYVEHSLDPVADLRRASALLRPGGIVAASTGDAGSLVARMSGRRWHLLTPRHHNYFFDRLTLRHALEQAGLVVRSMRTLAARYSLLYLVHKLQTMGSLPLAGRVAHMLEDTRIGSVAVPVDLFDIVTVVAQRPEEGSGDPDPR